MQSAVLGPILLNFETLHQVLARRLEYVVYDFVNGERRRTDAGASSASALRGARPRTLSPLPSRFLDAARRRVRRRRAPLLRIPRTGTGPPGFLHQLMPTRQADWVVCAKRPFAGPQQVLYYAGRYTHRIAISDSRLVNITDGQVTFRYKNYREAHPTPKCMAVPATEFIRFLLHVLPVGFIAFASTASSAIGTAPARSLGADTSSARLHRQPRLPHRSGLTIASGTRRSPASRCGPAPSVTTARCSSSSTCRAGTAASHHSIPH